MNKILLPFLILLLFACNQKPKGIQGEWKGYGERFYKVEKSLKYMIKDSVVLYENITATFKKDSLEINGFNKPIRCLYEFDNKGQLDLNSFVDTTNYARMPTGETLTLSLGSFALYSCEKYLLKNDTLEIIFHKLYTNTEDEGRYRVVLTRIDTTK